MDFVVDNDKGANSSRRHNSRDFLSGPVVKNLPCKAREAVSVPVSADPIHHGAAEAVHHDHCAPGSGAHTPPERP